MELIETNYKGRLVRMDTESRTFTEAGEDGVYGDPQPFEPDMARTIDEHEALEASAAASDALTVALMRALVSLRNFAALPAEQRPAAYATAYPAVEATMAAYLDLPVESRTADLTALYDRVQASVLRIALAAATAST